MRSLGVLGKSLGAPGASLGFLWRPWESRGASLGKHEIDRNLTEIAMVWNVCFCQLSVNFLSTWGGRGGSWRDRWGSWGGVIGGRWVLLGCPSDSFGFPASAAFWYSLLNLEPWEPTFAPPMARSEPWTCLWKCQVPSAESPLGLFGFALFP